MPLPGAAKTFTTALRARKWTPLDGVSVDSRVALFPYESSSFTSPGGGTFIGACPRTLFPTAWDFPSRGNEEYAEKKQ